jgi:hypothetical protein
VDDLVVRRVVALDLTPPLLLGARPGRLEARVRVTGELPGANLDLSVLGQVPGHRTLMQRIRPD